MDMINIWILNGTVNGSHRVSKASAQRTSHFSRSLEKYVQYVLARNSLVPFIGQTNSKKFKEIQRNSKKKFQTTTYCELFRRLKTKFLFFLAVLL